MESAGTYGNGKQNAAIWRRILELSSFYGSKSKVIWNETPKDIWEETAREELSNLGGFPCSSVGKEFAYSTGDPDSIPGLGRPPRERNGNPPLYSCLEHSMDRGAWWATVQEAIFFRSKYSKAQDLFLKNLYSNAGSFR